MRIKTFCIRLGQAYQESDEEELNEFLSLVKVNKTCSSLVQAEIPYWTVLVYHDEASANKSYTTVRKASYDKDTELDIEEQQIFEELKKWRSDTALMMNVPQYFVFTNTELIGVAKEKPEKLGDFDKLRGFGTIKISKYGDEILQIVNAIRNVT